MQPLEEVKAIFTGRVQGVSFRATCRRYALHYNIKGYVKNRPDGSVELVAQGTREALDLYLAAIGQRPRGAVIRSIKTDFSLPAQIYEQFTIQHASAI